MRKQTKHTVRSNTKVDIIRTNCAGKLENLLCNVGCSDEMAGKSLASGIGSSATYSLQLKILSTLGFLPKVILKYIVGDGLQKKKTKKKPRLGQVKKALCNRKLNVS